MKPSHTPSGLPSSLARKLKTIRQRDLALTWLTGLALTAAVFVAAMLLAMTVDRLVGWYDERARTAMSLAALVAGVLGFGFWCLRPLARRRTLISTAREIDERMPQLEERWSTVTELSHNTDAPEVRGSGLMIGKVAAEAESADSAIEPRSVVPARPAMRAALWLAGAAAVVLVWVAANFSEASVLLQRFWRPGADISLTRVEASPGTAWLPKGEPMSLHAAIDGRLPGEAPTLVLRSGEGSVKRIPMTADADDPRAFHHAIEELTGAFEYRVRAGDGQSPWHQVTAVDRPTISAVRLTVEPPAYSKLPREEQDSLPGSIRVLEGSDVEVSFQADQQLDRMLLEIGSRPPVELAAGADKWYRFRTRVTESFAFTASAVAPHGIMNRSKPSCRLSVYQDLPPAVKVLAPSDELAVLPGEKVNVTFEAFDDIGLAGAEVVVATTKADGTTSETSIPVPLDAGVGTKKARQSVELDPKSLGLKHGDELTYVVRVTDTKHVRSDASAPPATGSPVAASPESREGPPPTGLDETDATAEPSEPAATEGNPESAVAGDGKPASNVASSEHRAGAESPPSAAADPADSQPGPADPARDPQAVAESPDSAEPAKSGAPSPPQDSAAAGPQPAKAGAPPEGSQPPPNEMSKRMLDAGQTAECAPRRISVDEYAGTFEGERRKKLEIAIDPVLKQLSALLAGAQEKTDSLKEPAAAPPGLQPSHAQPLEGAKGNLQSALEVTGELNSRTANTPYAFIGLQLQNIGQAHTTPAQLRLGEVSLSAPDSAAPTVAANAPALDKASFHIQRARAMLDDLVKSFESIKNDQQLADAMQQLAKMYQVFLEDTQQLLGGKEAPLNSYQRKIAEVDEAFVEKLKDLMEQRKRILDELAKSLATDPRMLRRFLAMQQLQGTTYRDQMTLLAKRQAEIASQVAEWNQADAEQRPGLAERLQPGYAGLRGQVAVEAVKLRENMETWLPLDVKPDHPKVQEAFTRAETIARFAASPAPADAERALAELHALRDSMPSFSQIRTGDEAKLTAFIANRLTEVESLVTAHSGAVKIMESLERGDFTKAAEIVQHRITQETVVLGEKLEATAGQVAPLSTEIAAKAEALTTIVRGDILVPQNRAVKALGSGDAVAAAAPLETVVPAFALGESTFDELMRLIIAKLDEAPPPGDPGGAPSLDSLLTMLEDEMKAAEGLGIPCRPINVQMMTDWMKPGQGSQGAIPSPGQAQAQAQAAQAQAREARGESEKLAKEARDRARDAMARARGQSEAGKQAEPAPAPLAHGTNEAWNKLASRLEKNLLQGRDNTPPEQYRAAIENYFKILSETTNRAGK